MQRRSGYFKRGTKGRDWAQPVLEAKEERFEMPKLSMQNAPMKGKRRRIVEEEKTGAALALQHSVEAIFWESLFVMMVLGLGLWAFSWSWALFGIHFLVLLVGIRINKSRPDSPFLIPFLDVTCRWSWSNYIRRLCGFQQRREKGYLSWWYNRYIYIYIFVDIVRWIIILEEC